MKVINFFAGPGCGKSTTAAGLFHYMKVRSFQVELVTEYAKDLVWSERTLMLTEQDYIFAKQNHRLRRLRGKVDWVITDSPIILGHFYMPEDFPGKEHFCNFVNSMFNSYDNINILLTRVKKYDPVGRNQTEEEAKALDLAVKTFLDENEIPFFTVDADENAPKKVLDFIFDGNGQLSP